MCLVMKCEKGKVCLLHLQPGLQWSLCHIRRLSALRLHPTARLTVLEVPFFSLKLQTRGAKLSWRGPRAESGFYFCCSFRNTSPNFFKNRKGELQKSSITWFPPSHNLYLLTWTFLKGSWKEGYVVSGDTFPKKSHLADVCVTVSIRLLDLRFHRNAKAGLDESNTKGQECHFLNLQQTPFVKTAELYITNSKIYGHKILHAFTVVTA